MPPFDTTSLSRSESSSAYAIISRIWPSSGIEKESFSAELYQKFLQFANEEVHDKRRCISNVAIHTLNATLDVLESLRTNRNRTRGELLVQNSSRFINVDHREVLDQMDIAARLLLTLYVRSESSALGPIDIHIDPITWQDNQTLNDLVSDQIKQSCGQAIRHRHSAFGENFTAAFLSNTCGLNICWTNTLADHLRFNKRNRQVSIYQHKVCLLHHLESKEEPFFPRNLLEETLDTFELLFPWYDQNARNLLRHQNRPIYALGRCGRKRILEIDRYTFWGHRLSDLLDAYEAPPRDIWQRLKDQRNLNDWATFLIGFFVLVLTVVSIVTGTISTVYSIKQYNLALAQACAEEDAAITLPGFCA